MINLAKSTLTWWYAGAANYRMLMGMESTHLIAKVAGQRTAINEDVSLRLNEQQIVIATLSDGTEHELWPNHQVTANTEHYKRFWLENENGWNLEKNDAVQAVFRALRNGEAWFGNNLQIHGRGRGFADDTIDKFNSAVPIDEHQAVASNGNHFFVIQDPETEQGVINVLASRHHGFRRNVAVSTD